MILILCNFSSDFISPAKYEHETVIVENEYPHSAINLVSNTNHRIYHGNESDRHSDEYVTPISSPRLQQQPAAPQKLSNSINNSTAQSPNGISLSQSTVPLPSVSPNSAQNQVSFILISFTYRFFLPIFSIQLIFFNLFFTAQAKQRSIRSIHSYK